jgi:cyclohexanecarboxylate-CoA ligase
VLLDDNAAARSSDVLPTCPNLAAVFVPDALAGGRLQSWSACRDARAAAPRPRSPDEDTLVLYSSGSTGTPKGVVHTANSLRYAAEAVAARHHLSGRDTALVALEVGGTILGALAALLTGASTVLMRSWDPGLAIDLIARHRVSYTLLMPTHVYDILNSPGLDRADCRSLTRGILAGVPKQVREDAARRFCARPLPMFGMSESIGHVTCAPEDPWDALTTMDGRALAGTEISIRDADGHEVKSGTIGDLLLRGPNRLKAYLGAPDLTAAAILPDGWFRTGDKALLDERGFMLFCGRAKEIIRRGGVTIVPADVEAALMTHPGIAEVAVVPIPDARLGEKACACIVARPGVKLELEDIVRHLESQKLARYMQPEHLLLFDALPRTASLKVRRADLEAEARRRLDGPSRS